MGAAEVDAAPKPASVKSNSAESPQLSEKGRDVEASALDSVSSGEDHDLPVRCGFVIDRKGPWLIRAFIDDLPEIHELHFHGVSLDR
jgi:hypothetical protein